LLRRQRSNSTLRHRSLSETGYATSKRADVPVSKGALLSEQVRAGKKKEISLRSGPYSNPL
jgi:hypothetical protein